MINYWLCRKRQREEVARKAIPEETEINYLATKKWVPGKTMGLGKLGGTTVTFRSKFRWTLEVRSRGGSIILPEQYVKLKCRPHFTDLLSGVHRNYIFTKPDLKLSVTFTDIGAWDFWKVHKKLEDMSRFCNDATLRLYDSCGYVLESWHLHSIKTIHTDLRPSDFAANESVLDATFMFKTAKYYNNCFKK